MRLWSSHSLTCSLRDDGLYFEPGVTGGIRLPLSDLPGRTVAALPDLNRWLALEALWGEGSVVEAGDCAWRLSFDGLYQIDDDTRRSLELPSPQMVSTEVRAVGAPGKPSFGIDVQIRHPAIGTLEGATDRFGPLYIPSIQAPILMPKATWELLELARQSPTDEGLEGQLLYLSRVKELAARCGARLDQFLAAQEVATVESVGVSIEEVGPEEIRLRPSLRTGERVDVPPALVAGGTVPRVLSVRSGGKVHRVVFGPPARQTISAIHERPSITGVDVPRFIENPQGFLPPEADLSEYSARVKGLRTVVYNSRPYLHVRPGAGGWFEGIPGLEIEPAEGGASAASGSREVTPEEFRRIQETALAGDQEFVRHGDGWVRVNRNALAQLQNAADGAEARPDGTMRLTARAVLAIYENLESLEFELPPAEMLGLHPQLSDFPDLPLPGTFECNLMPHQQVGYRWLSYLQTKGTGGLLADDMGLGKTIQVIAHFAKLAESGELVPSLVVCPKTLIENWQREIARFLPSVQPLIYFGQVQAAFLATQQVVLTSYDTLRYRQLDLAKIDWRTVVCDEAQYAKNPTAQRTAAVKALKCDHRVALTGTPVENGLIEFWCILDFVRPGHLGSWADFRTTFERPLVEVTTEEERRPLVDRLVTHLGPHYLRRLKDDVLRDLPPKAEQTTEVGFGERQLQVYKRVAQHGRSGGRGAALAAISKLIMVCGHPEVVEPEGSGFTYRPGDCPKLDQTVALLTAIRERGEKAIVFTRFVELQGLLQRTFASAFGLWPAVINGQMTGSRQRVVDMFEKSEGFGLLILSHDVGGIGLNITAANHVVHYTRPWNPAKENQGTDRAHRIGQKKPVTVHYPVIAHPQFTTVEMRLAALLDSKRSLARDVLRPTKDFEVKPDELMACLEMR